MSMIMSVMTFCDYNIIVAAVDITVYIGYVIILTTQSVLSFCSSNINLL